MVSYFRYLGKKITERGKIWTAVVGNLRKALKQWARPSMILG